MSPPDFIFVRDGDDVVAVLHAIPVRMPSGELGFKRLAFRSLEELPPLLLGKTAVEVDRETFDRDYEIYLRECSAPTA